jgi:hypothetical protein
MQDLDMDRRVMLKMDCRKSRAIWSGSSNPK